MGAHGIFRASGFLSLVLVALPAISGEFILNEKQDELTNRTVTELIHVEDDDNAYIETKFLDSNELTRDLRQSFGDFRDELKTLNISMQVAIYDANRDPVSLFTTDRNILRIPLTPVRCVYNDDEAVHEYTAAIHEYRNVVTVQRLYLLPPPDSWKMGFYFGITDPVTRMNCEFRSKDGITFVAKYDFTASIFSEKHDLHEIAKHDYLLLIRERDLLSQEIMEGMSSVGSEDSIKQYCMESYLGDDASKRCELWISADQYIDVLGVWSGDLAGGKTQDKAGSQDVTRLVNSVLAETAEIWEDIFRTEGNSYRKPSHELSSGPMSSSCDPATPASGPFYCLLDEKIFVDVGFFDLVARRFDNVGELAHAYLLAHEVGHHVQNLIGILQKFREIRQQMSVADASVLSTRVELQADCFAGIWGRSTNQEKFHSEGVLEVVLNAAIEATTTAVDNMPLRIVPNRINNGTLAQRKKWFLIGFQSGRLADCDTFNNPI